MKSPLMIAGLVLVVLGSGCADNTAVGPGQRNLSLRIELDAVPREEATVAVGDSIQLTASLFDSDGDPASAGAVSWRSTAPAVASVSGSGLVKGVEVGVAKIVASTGPRSDTVRVDVAQPVTGPIDCAADDTPIDLAPGGVYTTTADQAVTLCVTGGADGAEFVYIPFNGSSAAAAELPVSITGANIVGVTGPPSPSLGARSSATAALRPDASFHRRMLVESQLDMGGRLRAVTSQSIASPRFAALPAVGDLLELNVESGSEDSCSGDDIDLRTGRVMAVTEKAIVVADTANPKYRGQPTFDEEDYRSFASTFDTLVWKVDTENFGTPSDIDGNGRVLIFYTRAVNELTARDNQDSYTGGFFYNRDLFPTSGPGKCEGSNHAEMFYMMVPDPYGEINGHVRTVRFVREHTVAVLAHEFQHLINDSRRLYVNKTPVWEEPWLNEGLSHIAEELTFYHTSGLKPGQNIDASALATFSASRAFTRYQKDNIDRWIEYLEKPDTATLIGDDELATRGAAWSFLRYAADRRGGNQSTLWQSLVKDASASGLDNLRGALATDPRDWMEDWAISVYTDDAGLDLADPTRYTQPSWNFRDLLSGATGTFPLDTLALAPNVARNLSLRGGGTAFVRFGVAADHVAGLRTTVDHLPGPLLLHIAIVRTK